MILAYNAVVLKFILPHSNATHQAPAILHLLFSYWSIAYKTKPTVGTNLNTCHSVSGYSTFHHHHLFDIRHWNKIKKKQQQIWLFSYSVARGISLVRFIYYDYSVIETWSGRCRSICFQFFLSRSFCAYCLMALFHNGRCTLLLFHNFTVIEANIFTKKKK